MGGRLIFTLGAAVMLCSACASSLEVKKIAADDQTTTGLRYSLKVPKLQIINKVKNVYDPTDPDHPITIPNATAQIVIVPDPNYTYGANLKPGTFTSDTYGITYAPDGGLDSYNFTTQDQTATVIADIGKVAGNAAILAAGQPQTVQISLPKQSSEDAALDALNFARLKAAQARLTELKVKLDLIAKNGSDCGTNTAPPSPQADGKAPPTDYRRCLTEGERNEIPLQEQLISALQDSLWLNPSQPSVTTYYDLVFMPQNSEETIEQFVGNNFNVLHTTEPTFVAIVKRLP